MKKGGFVYILTNSRHTVFYLGVTSNLQKRLWEHQQKIVAGFTQKYNCTKLIYFEFLPTIELAISREKYLKGKKRAYKLNLIKSQNPNFLSLLPPETP